MSAVGNIVERLQIAFTPASGGVVGVVDELLSLCHEDGLRLDWRSDKCHMQMLGAEPREAIDVPMPIAVFRTILARVAAMYNEGNPDSVSPYCGQGKLIARTAGLTSFHGSLTNTPSYSDSR